MEGKERWLGHFRRSLWYLWPQRRRIAIGIACALGLAFSYSTGIFTIYPVVKVLISDEGPRTAVFRAVAEERLKATLSRPDPRKDGFNSRLALDGAAVVREIKDDSPLSASEVGVRTGDWLLLPVDAPSTTESVFEWLGSSTSDGLVTVRTLPPGADTPRNVTLTVRSIPLYYDWAVRVAHRLPQENTGEGKISTLIAFLVVIFCVNVTGNFCRFWAEYLIEISAARAMMDLRRHMFASVLNLKMTWFSSHLSETMSRVVRDSQDILRGYNAIFGKMTVEPLKAMAVFVVALVYDYRMTLVVVIGAPIGGLVLRKIGQKIRKGTRRMLQGYARMLGVLNATLNGMRVVRAYTREGFERRRIWQTERKMFQHMRKIAWAESASSPFLESLAVALGMFGLVWFARRTVSGEMQPENLFYAVVLLAGMFDPIRKVLQVFPRVVQADSAAKRVFELIDMPVEQKKGLWLDKLPSFRSNIEFRNVTFYYPDTTEPALSDVSFTVRAGENIAIVGPNGSGKTTVVSLFLRFFEPNEGTVFVDGRDIREVSVRSLRQQVSLVTQDAVVFAMTARENIAYGRLNATEEELLDAARRARADEFIRRLPQGYDTVIGEFGETLSGGECQRLSLARAILRNAPIFIFDEATSQVDVDSEKKIREAMFEFMRDRTSLVIAHRIATIQHADKIVVLDRGRVVDTGKHQELLDRCDLYRTLYYTHLHGHMVPPSAP